MCEERRADGQGILSGNREIDSRFGCFGSILPQTTESECDMAVLPRPVLVFFLCVLALPLGGSGCNQGDRPPLGIVRGTVTLDGKALSGVIVRFEPEEGRAAAAVTDADGKYDLIYVHGVEGAEVGSNKVSFVWPDGETGGTPIPKKYSGESELTVQVEQGKNTFDFPLETE